MANLIKTQDFLSFSSNILNIFSFNHLAVDAKNQSISKKAQTFVRQSAFMMIVVNSIIMYSLVLMFVMANANDLVKATSQPNIAATPGILIRIIATWRNRGRLIHIVEKLGEILERNSPHNSVAQRAFISFRTFAKILIFIFSLSFSINILGPILHFLSTRETKLPVQLWLPFDEANWKNFLFIYPFTAITSLGQTFLLCACELLLYGTLHLTSTCFEMLSRSISNIDVRQSNLKSRIIEMVKQQNELMSIVDALEDIFSASILGNFIGSSLTICLAGFQFTSSKAVSDTRLKYAIFLVVSMVQVLTLCSFSQKIIDSSSSIAVGAYNIEWYSIQDLKVRRMMVLIIMKSQKYKRLTAMKFAEVSIESFTVVSCANFACKMGNNFNYCNIINVSDPTLGFQLLHFAEGDFEINTPRTFTLSTLLRHLLSHTMN